MLREKTSKPVIGILESAIVQAMLVGQRFGIVTTGVGYKYVHYTEVRNFLGATSERFAGLIAVGLGVVELREGDRQKIITNMKEGSKRIAEKGADVVILGCAGKKLIRYDGTVTVTRLPCQRNGRNGRLNQRWLYGGRI